MHLLASTTTTLLVVYGKSTVGDEVTRKIREEEESGRSSSRSQPEFVPTGVRSRPEVPKMYTLASTTGWYTLVRDSKLLLV